VAAVGPALEALDMLLDRTGEYFPEAAVLVAERLARPVDGALSRPVALRLAGLMHLIPPAEALRAGRRFKLSTNMLALLDRASRDHAENAAGSWPTLPASGPRGREAVLFMWRSAPWEPEVVLLAAAARAAAGDAEGLEGGLQRQLAPARRLLAFWADRELGRLRRSPVDGDMLAERLGLPSGPLLGAVLREVRLAWEAGEISTDAAAMDLARSCSACES
jgi:hypothetical protein